MSSHAHERTRGLAITSENRDEPWASALQQVADDMERVLGELARRDDGSLERAVASLRLSGPRGPTPLNVPESRVAWDLAKVLALNSLDGLRTALERAPMTVGIGWPVEPPPPNLNRLPDETSFGIPLLAASSELAVDAMSRMLAARQLPKFAPVHANLDVRLAEFLAYEDMLWLLAERDGGAAPRIPYAFRVRALTWFWNPAVHQDGRRAPTLCFRCGVLIFPRRAIAAPPRCHHCAQEPPNARRWPPHAVAAAERGTWWLACLAKGCGNLFVSRSQARRCPECRSSSTTPSRRRSLPRAIEPH